MVHLNTGWNQVGLNKPRTPALGFPVSVRGTKCTTGAADGFSHILLSMAVHPSEPWRCLGTGLMLVEGNHHAGSKCSCWCLDTVLILQQCQAVSCMACKSCNLKRLKDLAVHSMTVLVMIWGRRLWMVILYSWEVPQFVKSLEIRVV